MLNAMTIRYYSDTHETSFKWYKLYSNKSENRFTIGSIKLKFSVSLTSRTSANQGKHNIKRNEESDFEDSEFLSDASSYISSNMESEDELSQSEIENVPNNLSIQSSRPPSLHSVDSSTSLDGSFPDFLTQSLDSYILSLKHLLDYQVDSKKIHPLKLININSQNYYYDMDDIKENSQNGNNNQDDANDQDYVNKTDSNDDKEEEEEDEEEDEVNKKYKSDALKQRKWIETPQASRVKSTKVPNIEISKNVSPRKEKIEKSDKLKMFLDGHAYNQMGQSDNILHYNSSCESLNHEPLKTTNRSKLSLLKANRYLNSSSKLNNSSNQSLQPPKRERKSAFEFYPNKAMSGILLLDILSIENLPPVPNSTRTSFDVDPFVTITFGKKNLRTSWKRHDLNPTYYEKLNIIVEENEENFDIVFKVFDRDRFTKNDKICYYSINLNDLLSKFHDPKLDNVEQLNKLDDYFFNLQDFSFKLKLNSEVLKDFKDYISLLNVKVGYNDFKLFKKYIWKLLLVQLEPEIIKNNGLDIVELSRFVESLNLNGTVEYFNDNASMSGIDEDESILPTSKNLGDGLQNLDDRLLSFFESKKIKSPYITGSKLNIFDCIEFLEDITKNQTNFSVKLEECPLCKRKTTESKKESNDIFDHLIDCTKNMWSPNSKSMRKKIYATSDAARRNWYSTVLLEFAYGKMSLGSNNANILVQHRSTGYVIEEKMSVYVRLGIKVIYQKLNSSTSNRKVKKILRNLSFKQGAKYDKPSSVKYIQSFIDFHNLDLSECLYGKDLSNYKTFNEFFYRKLRPDARPVEAVNNNKYAVAGADCRCTVFQNLTIATEVWIKGKNFTIRKLLDNNYPDLINTLYRNPAVAIFRLAPQDYHRFHSSVAGKIGKITHIEGEYFTVNPMAIRSEVDVYGENVRVLIPIHTKEFGIVMMICVGAMMVGSTVLTVNEGDRVERGDEVGYFKFGGSTVLLIFPDNSIKFDADIAANSRGSIETLVRVGMSIGHSPDEVDIKRVKRKFDEISKEEQRKIIRSLSGSDEIPSHPTISRTQFATIVEEDHNETVHGDDSNKATDDNDDIGPAIPVATPKYVIQADDSEELSAELPFSTWEIENLDLGEIKATELDNDEGVSLSESENESGI
ncbi:unnamed protein product [[Candida] boidinii]|uniref:Phosphatidylserine decarboxylase proenzyme 2 n=1 Tax=Candida boidinii TaxID=5477 RepID=A0A9W6WF62_CANBO|nr:unnamed protein product [[Candida] boidinii]